MSDFSNQVLRDLQIFKDKNAWENDKVPDWAVERAKVLGVRTEDRKVFEWAFWLVISEFERRQAITAQEFEAQVEKRVFQRLKELGINVGDQLGRVGRKTTKAILGFGSEVSQRFGKLVQEAKDQSKESKDQPDTK